MKEPHAGQPASPRGICRPLPVQTPAPAPFSQAQSASGPWSDVMAAVRWVGDLRAWRSPSSQGTVRTAGGVDLGLGAHKAQSTGSREELWGSPPSSLQPHRQNRQEALTRTMLLPRRLAS